MTLAPLVALTACGSAPKVVAPAPTAVTCADAPQLRQRAVDDRRQVDELKSDQDKVYIGSADFKASEVIALLVQQLAAPPSK